MTLRQAYEGLRTVLGQEQSQRLGALNGRDLERFAIASHDPRWASQDGRPSGTVPEAPPLYLSSVMGWSAGPRENELRADGSGLDETRGLPLDGVRLMGAGQSLEFHEPVREGDSVVVHTSLTDVELKTGRSGDLLILQISRRFTDDSGRPLVTCRESFIAR
jgi:hypothetical protein